MTAPVIFSEEMVERECATCHATVAVFPAAMSCHCTTTPWKVKPAAPTPDDLLPQEGPWWMIERNDLNEKNYIGGRRPMYFCWDLRPDPEAPRHVRGGRHDWTPDWQKGERFATKEEAEAHTNDDPLLSVVEHSMTAKPLPQEGLVERAIDQIMLGRFVAQYEDASAGFHIDADEAQEVALQINAALSLGTAIMDEVHADTSIPTDVACKIYAAIKRANATTPNRLLSNSIEIERYREALRVIGEQCHTETRQGLLAIVEAAIHERMKDDG